MSALSSHSAGLSALGSRSAGLSALFSRMRTCVSHILTISLAACGCRQLRECDGSGGGVPIVSYLVDKCHDFIGKGGEGEGETYYSYSAQSTEEKSDSPSFFRV